MIICAALQIITKENQEIILPCVKHEYGYKLEKELNINRWYCIEGFLTEENKFLNRIDSLRHAIECKQLPISLIQKKKDKKEDELYSEDLY